jgi:hypothetical protein
MDHSCARTQTCTRQGKLGNARLVATVKEVAPTSMAKNDEELGVGEFVSKYFSNGEVFLDINQDFYEALGARCVVCVCVFVCVCVRVCIHIHTYTYRSITLYGGI